MLFLSLSDILKIVYQCNSWLLSYPNLCNTIILPCKTILNPHSIPNNHILILQSLTLHTIPIPIRQQKYILYSFFAINSLDKLINSYLNVIMSSDIVWLKIFNHCNVIIIGGRRIIRYLLFFWKFVTTDDVMFGIVELFVV